MPSAKATTRDDERRLLALLLGELPREEARDLERRLAESATLRASRDRLAAVWASLEAPPREPVPAGFREAVTATARRHARGELSWSLAPAWARAGAAAALVAGLLAGLGVGRGDAAPGETASIEAEVAAYLGAELEATTLAESYWRRLEESDELDLGEAP